jgi:hypothetical protein
LNQAGLVKYVYVIQKCLRTIEVVRKWPSEKIVKVFRKNIFRLKLVMCEKQKNYYLTTILISEWFLQGCFLFELSKKNFFFADSNESWNASGAARKCERSYDVIGGCSDFGTRFKMLFFFISCLWSFLFGFNFFRNRPKFLVNWI